MTTVTEMARNSTIKRQLSIASRGPLQPVGEWNSSRIVEREGKVEHYLNGVVVMEIEIPSEDWSERYSPSSVSDGGCRPLRPTPPNPHPESTVRTQTLWPSCKLCYQQARASVCESSPLN